MTSRIGGATLVVLIILTTTTRLALGFNAMYLFGGKTGSRNHQSITKDALTTAAQKYMTETSVTPTDQTGKLNGLGFRRARTDLVKSVPHPDLELWAYHPQDHFDSETIPAGHQRLIDHRRMIVDNIRRRNVKNARYLLARALHTVQDFYSHSNWVEQFSEVETNKEIGNEAVPIVSDLATPTDPTCINATGTGPCSSVNLVTDKLTTGYFNFTIPLDVVDWMFKASKSNVKCSHGGGKDKSSLLTPTGGINKDDLGSNHGCKHLEAATLAATASVEYIESIRSSLNADDKYTEFIGLTSKKTICLGLGLSGNVASAIAALATVVGLFSATQPDINYVIPLFDVPGYGSVVFEAANPSIITTVLDAISAVGTLDLSTMAMYGLDLAISKIAPGSACLVLADGPAQDGLLFPFVVAHALDNNIKVSVLSVVDTAGSDGSTLQRRRRRSLSRRRRSVAAPDYDLLARLTGGTVAEVDVGDQLVASLYTLTTMMTIDSLVTVYAADSVSTGQFTFTVDSTLDTVYITITDNSGSLSTVTMTSPAGTNFEGYTLSVDGKIKIYDMGKLDVGQWTVAMVNDGSPVSVKVTAASAVGFSHQFATLVDGPHPAYQVDAGNPLTGLSDYTLIVDITGALDAVTMESADAILNITSVLLVSASGEMLATLTANELVPLQQYVAFPPALTAGFRVVIEGLDADSNVFQRYTDSFIMPSTVCLEVKVQGDGVLGTQSDVTVSVNVTNYGPATTYYLQITDTLDFYVGETPISVELEAGASQVVELHFSLSHSSDVSGATESGNTTVVTVTVGGQTAISVSNYRVFTLTLGPSPSDEDSEDSASEDSAENSGDDENDDGSGDGGNGHGETGNTCSVVESRGSCSAASDNADSCSSGTWTAHIHVSDKNVGLHSVRAVTSDPDYVLDVKNFKDGTRATVNAYYTGSCCHRAAQIETTNVDGAMVTCDLVAPSKTTGGPARQTTVEKKNKKKKGKCAGEQGAYKKQCLNKLKKEAKKKQARYERRTKKGRKGKQGGRRHHRNVGGLM